MNSLNMASRAQIKSVSNLGSVLVLLELLMTYKSLSRTTLLCYLSMLGLTVKMVKTVGSK